jgi:NADPH2:quinone reductase
MAFPVGSRVMFTGPYGLSENGTYSEWLAVRKENLCLIPDNIEALSAAGLPVAYLTAQMTLNFARFAKGKDRAVTRHRRFSRKRSHSVAKAQGARLSTTTNHSKAQKIPSLGFGEVIDLSVEKP